MPRHTTLYLYELAWMLPSVAIPVGMLAALAVTAFGAHIGLPGEAGRIVAALESGARARGGKGLIVWFTKLPWGDPSLTAQVLAMLLFAFGGIGGLVNASYSVNLVVHNTAYIVGHFHLTVGTAVTLSFMGITYWLVPVLRGRGLWSRRLALVQSWLWFVSMGLFSFALHDLGMLGMPRRTMISAAPYIQPEWRDTAVCECAALFPEPGADLCGVARTSP